MGRLTKYSRFVLKKYYIAGGTLVFGLVLWVALARPAIREASFRDYAQRNNPSVGSEQIDGYGQIYYEYENIRTYITKDESNNISPVSYKSFISWQKQQAAGQFALMLYDIRTKQTLQLTYLRTTSGVSLGDNLIAWQGQDGQKSSIYYYNGRLINKIDSKYSAIRPFVDGDRIVFTQQTSSSKDRWQVIVFDSKNSKADIVTEGTAAHAAWPRVEDGVIESTLEGSARYY